MATYYKWLLADGSAPIGKGKWTDGRWRSVRGPLVPCKNGLHLCRPADLLHHVSERLWIAEADPSEIIEQNDKIVVRRARVIERVETINDCTLRLFAADCAERAGHLTGPHPACVASISVARRYAHGQATMEELDAAWSAAWAAARAAARAASGAAAGAAARDAARAAALAAVWAAAWEAARAAAWEAARDAAWEAARAAAWEAARDAAWDAQTKRLLQYIQHGEAAEAMPFAGSR